MIVNIVSLCVLYTSLLVWLPKTAHAFDLNAMNVSLWHSENAYCDPSTYLTRTNHGLLSNFVATYHIKGDSDTEGYVGYDPSLQLIVVAYRGTSDIANWATNLDAVTTDYPNCDNCKVHHGFYSAEQSFIQGVVNEVASLRQKYSSYKVLAAGHSLGAALATLTAVDIDKAGYGPVTVYNFGSPRVFNDDGAKWVSDKLSHYRITHHKDMVVHVPMHERFTHINSEKYESDDTLNLMDCTGYEDPNCSYQWDITSISDHLWYYGMTMGQDGCAFILGNR